MLVHTSILDIKTREVDLKIWLIYSPLIIFLYFDYRHVIPLLYIYSVVTTNVLIYVFYRLALMGGADLFLSIILSLSNAAVYPIFFPRFSELGIEPLVIVLYASLLIGISAIMNLLRNIGKVERNLPFSTKLSLLISGKKITVRQFLDSKFLFPLTQVNEDGTVSIRTSFSVDEDDAEWRKKFQEYIEKGIIKEDDEIWVVWGVPVIPFILAGYVLSLIIGLPL
ncbi:peptidase A24 [Stygiolobus caldivivus]|uniref:Peptidase A24 n=2 Tax=Stygiolobus caldivivus TaxID=2824673 RepID=A0A8D5U575_9CREN|nr:peptidase A24 [Stygiolobus caldivivus]